MRFSQERISVEEPIGMRGLMKPLTTGVGEMSGLPALPIPAINPFLIPMSACERGHNLDNITKRADLLPCKSLANQ
jgi:hypothetical protein